MFLCFQVFDYFCFKNVGISVLNENAASKLLNSLNLKVHYIL